jgi:hypothetical protein
MDPLQALLVRPVARLDGVAALNVAGRTWRELGRECRTLRERRREGRERQ